MRGGAPPRGVVRRRVVVRRVGWLSSTARVPGPRRDPACGARVDRAGPKHSPNGPRRPLAGRGDGCVAPSRPRLVRESDRLSKHPAVRHRRHRQEARMELSGRLATVQIGDVLQLAHQERWSGALVVRRSSREKRIFLDRGQVVGCLSDDPAEFYGRHLLIRGVLSESDLATALAWCSDHRRRLGTALRELGLLSEDEVRATLASRISDAVCDLFLWDRGVFYLAGDRPPEEEIPPRTARRLRAGDGGQPVDRRAPPNPQGVGQRPRGAAPRTALAAGRGRAAAASPGGARGRRRPRPRRALPARRRLALPFPRRGLRAVPRRGAGHRAGGLPRTSPPPASCRSSTC